MPKLQRLSSVRVSISYLQFYYTLVFDFCQIIGKVKCLIIFKNNFILFIFFNYLIFYLIISFFIVKLVVELVV